MAYYSPLRYPGGKGKMFNRVKNIIVNNNLAGCTYIEPFAGGANLALNLLFKGYVKDIIINDADPAIYAFWHSILFDSEAFIKKIKVTPITIEEYARQKDTYNSHDSSLFDKGFATFYLNRTNRSGIIKGGIIGGKKQDGDYLMDCRFNKNNLIKRINKISENKNKILLFKEDARDFLTKQSFPENSFFFIDPPYYEKGSQLYTNYFTHEDHVEISKIVKQLQYPWIVTYDNAEPVIEMYNFSDSKEYSISYSVSTKRLGSEIMFYKNMLLI